MHKRRSGRGNIHGNALVVCAEFFEGADQAVGMADHFRAGCVRLIFALAGNSELQQQRRDRREE